MIAINHESGTFWLRLKIFFTLGKPDQKITTLKPAEPKLKRHSHRTTVFFKMP